MNRLKLVMLSESFRVSAGSIQRIVGKNYVTMRCKLAGQTRVGFLHCTEAVLEYDWNKPVSSTGKIISQLGVRDNIDCKIKEIVS